MAKATSVLKAIVVESVSDWSGIEANGGALPCTAENKLLLLETTADNADGEKSTFWAVLNEKFAAMEEAEAKN